MNLSRLIIINSNLSRKKFITKRKGNISHGKQVELNDCTDDLNWAPLPESMEIHWSTQLEYIFLLLYFACLLMLLVLVKEKRRVARLTDIKRAWRVPVCYNFVSLLCSNHENTSKISFCKDFRDKCMRRWVNPIKPVIETSTDNWEMGKCEGTERKKKSTESMSGQSSPDWNQKLIWKSRRITQSTSWHTGNNTAFLHIMFGDDLLSIITV